MSSQRSQSFFKHRFLDRYVSSFAFKLGSRGDPIWIVDGFAGPGVYEDGTPASGRMLLDLGTNRENFSIVLMERKAAYVDSLQGLATQAQAATPGRAPWVHVVPGDTAENLPKVIDAARGAHVFMYLDPCGYGLSFEDLVSMFSGRGNWPRTELMLNFSADLVRRLGGSHLRGAAEAGKLTAACGGDWWIELAQPMVERDGNWSNALTAVMDALTAKLADALQRHVLTVPIRATRAGEPKFHMVCATSSGHGILSLSDAFAKAWDDWSQHVDWSESGQLTLFEDSKSQVVGVGRDVVAASKLLRDDTLRYVTRRTSVGNVAHLLLSRSAGILKESEIRRELKAMEAERLIGFLGNKHLGSSEIYPV